MCIGYSYIMAVQDVFTYINTFSIIHWPFLQCIIICTWVIVQHAMRICAKMINTTMHSMPCHTCFFSPTEYPHALSPDHCAVHRSPYPTPPPPASCSSAERRLEPRPLLLPRHNCPCGTTRSYRPVTCFDGLVHHLVSASLAHLLAGLGGHLFRAVSAGRWSCPRAREDNPQCLYCVLQKPCVRGTTRELPEHKDSAQCYRGVSNWVRVRG
jgi:hypothetical protein